MKDTKFMDRKTGLIIGSSSALLLATASSVQAQNADPVQDVSDSVSSIGNITGVAAGVVIAAMGVRMAIKQVNRIMVKG